MSYRVLSSLSPTPKNKEMNERVPLDLTRLKQLDLKHTDALVLFISSLCSTLTYALYILNSDVLFRPKSSELTKFELDIWVSILSYK